MSRYQNLADSIIKGDNIRSSDIAQKLIKDGVPAIDILNNGLVPGMDVVGKKFEANEFYLPEVLLAARAMKAAMEIIKPLLSESGAETKGTIIIGTVKGDIHEIGKNLVGMMLEGGGYTVIDLGVDVPPEKFVEETKKNSVKLIGMSALLTTTMMGMKTVIDMIKTDEKTADVKVMVGGAPLNQEFADSIGAHGYAPDASGAVGLAARLLG
ncbi:MAG: methyltransferase [Actinobacteria bacterium RBG_13_35_12]|nr:MAG: methyltransferase [Actinobacteria bacterium RBG_13_35_12]